MLQQVDLVGKDLVPVQKQRHPGCSSGDGERESRMEILVPDTRPVHTRSRNAIKSSSPDTAHLSAEPEEEEEPSSGVSRPLFYDTE